MELIFGKQNNQDIMNRNVEINNENSNIPPAIKEYEIIDIDTFREYLPYCPYNTITKFNLWNCTMQKKYFIVKNKEEIKSGIMKKLKEDKYIFEDYYKNDNFLKPYGSYLRELSESKKQSSRNQRIENNNKLSIMNVQNSRNSLISERYEEEKEVGDFEKLKYNNHQNIQKLPDYKRQVERFDTVRKNEPQISSHNSFESLPIQMEGGGNDLSRKKSYKKQNSNIKQNFETYFLNYAQPQDNVSNYNSCQPQDSLKSLASVISHRIAKVNAKHTVRLNQNLCKQGLQ